MIKIIIQRVIATQNLRIDFQLTKQTNKAFHCTDYLTQYVADVNKRYGKEVVKSAYNPEQKIVNKKGKVVYRYVFPLEFAYELVATNEIPVELENFFNNITNKFELNRGQDKVENLTLNDPLCVALTTKMQGLINSRLIPPYILNKAPALSGAINYVSRHFQPVATTPPAPVINDNSNKASQEEKTNISTANTPPGKPPM